MQTILIFGWPYVFFRWFWFLQCTKKTSWLSVSRHRARLHPSHPARGGSQSSYWCLFGWEGSSSTRPTSNASRFESCASDFCFSDSCVLNSVEGFLKNPLPSVPEVTFQTIVFSSRTSYSWTVVSESSGGNRNIPFILLASKVRTKKIKLSN